MSRSMTDEDVDRLLKTAAGYAVWCVGMSDEAMTGLLRQAQEHLRAELAPKFGQDAADTIAAAFPDAVLAARRAAGGTPPVVN